MCPVPAWLLPLALLLVGWATLGMMAVDGATFRAAPPTARRKDNATCYVVRAKSSVPDSTIRGLYNATNGTEGSLWLIVYRGFHKCLDDPAGLAALLNNTDVEDVQEAKLLRLAATQVLPDGNPNLWHLDRIDQRPRVLDGLFEYENTGKGVPIYVVDSAILATHQEFADRLSDGWRIDASGDMVPTDLHCVTHGTHVAGIAAGNTTGAAKEATVVPVAVFNCTDDFIPNPLLLDALEWVAQQPPGVVTLSLYGPGAVDSPENLAVRELVQLGFAVVTAAGNNASDACSMNPANSPFIITVGSTNLLDIPGDTSNYGGCIDIWAPGEQVTSASIEGNASYTTMSGTSMAAALVSGVVATLKEEFPTHSAAELAAILTGQATPGVLVDARLDSPDLMLYMGAHQCDPNVNTTGCREVQLLVRGDTAASQMGWSIAESCPYQRWKPGTLKDGAGARNYTLPLCLAPGNYTFAAEDLLGRGWTTGWFMVLLADTQEELLGLSHVQGYGVRAPFEVPTSPEATATPTAVDSDKPYSLPIWMWAIWIPIGALVVVIIIVLWQCLRERCRVRVHAESGRAEAYLKEEDL